MTNVASSVGAILLLVATLGVAQNAPEPIEPIPASLAIDSAKAELGQRLFFDAGLSRSGDVSCASCHDLGTKFGTDLRTVSVGIDGRMGRRNSPTVLNAALNFKQFWDGRVDGLTEQAEQPVINPDEMGWSDWSEAVGNVESTYDADFQRIYGQATNAEDIQHALAEFQKTLLTPNSRFDQYLLGDRSVLSEQEKQGYGYFKSYGCSACHQGANVGGNMFQTFGVLKDINLRAQGNVDLGRYEVTNNEWDKHVFKVPSLRLAVHTPPYFHDGSVETIEEAVNIMIEYQLGRSVPTDHRDDIIAFLHSLVGDLPELTP